MSLLTCSETNFAKMNNLDEKLDNARDIVEEDDVITNSSRWSREKSYLQEVIRNLTEEKEEIDEKFKLLKMVVQNMCSQFFSITDIFFRKSPSWNRALMSWRTVWPKKSR